MPLDFHYECVFSKQAFCSLLRAGKCGNDYGNHIYTTDVMDDDDVTALNSSLEIYAGFKAMNIDKDSAYKLVL